VRTATGALSDPCKRDVPTTTVSPGSITKVLSRITVDSRLFGATGSRLKNCNHQQPKRSKGREGPE